MSDIGMKDPRETSLSEWMDRQYLEAENKPELDYWAPLAQIIMEAIEARDAQDLTQADLAAKMKTKQPVISRFENMGRLPNYDFIARLAIALNHAPGMTLYGEYMAVVPQEKHDFVDQMATKQGLPARKMVELLLGRAIATQENAGNQFGFPAGLLEPLLRSDWSLPLPGASAYPPPIEERIDYSQQESFRSHYPQRGSHKEIPRQESATATRVEEVLDSRLSA